MNSDPSENLPELVVFNDFERAWQTFTMLEAFADQFGGWRTMDVLGQPIYELPDDLVQDLLNIRMVAGIVERQNSRRRDKSAEEY